MNHVFLLQEFENNKINECSRISSLISFGFVITKTKSKDIRLFPLLFVSIRFRFSESRPERGRFGIRFMLFGSGSRPEPPYFPS